MTRRLLSRFALRLVPGSWRETVASDLDFEARALGRGSVWITWHTLLAAARLRSTTLGDLLWTDVRYAVRSLLRARWFTAGAVATLALGIGVNLAVFTVVDRILFRPLPVHDVSSLALVGWGDQATGVRSFTFDKHVFIEIRRRVPAIEDLAFAGSTSQYRLSADPDDPSSLRLTQASFNALAVLGTTPVRGRSFGRDDVVAGRPAVVITHEAWRGRFGGGDVVGRPYGAGQRRFEIVGVLPPGFLAPTVNFRGGSDGLIVRQDLLETVGPRETVAASFARLHPGVSRERLQQELSALVSSLDAGRTGGRGPRTIAVEPFRAGVFSLVWPYFSLMAAAAGFVWLMTAANLCGLLLARGRSREHVAALQTAIGASRRRVMAGALVEGALVSMLGALAALFVLHFGLSSFQAVVPNHLRPFALPGIDGRLAAVALGAALVAAVAAGLLPAWRASRVDVLEVLQRSASTGRSRRLRGGRVVLATQAAFGVLFVAGAAVMVRNFVGYLNTDFGFEPRGLHIVNVALSRDPAGSRSDPIGAAAEPLILAALRELPGVTAVGSTDIMLAAGALPFTFAAMPDGARIGVWQMSEGFLEAIGARLLAGRDLERADITGRRDVAVVTRATVELVWPGIEPFAAIGRPLVIPNEPTRQVVGVIADLLDQADRPPVAKMYLPTGNPEYRRSEYAVRASTPPDAAVLRSILASRAGATDVAVRPADAVIRAELERPRLQAVLFTSFAVVALVLAVIGLYAIASFDVALRRGELGIRVAIGADRRDLRRLLMVDALLPVGTGLVVGLAGTWWASRFAEAYIHQVDARDPWTLALVVLTLIATAVVAAWIPARRAARTDPAVVLRQT